jgi:nitroreductase
MVDFWQVIKKRHCCRSFDSTKKVDEKLIKKILEAGRIAPSAGGIHPEVFIVIKESKIKNQLAKAALGQYFIAQAPVILVICADVNKTKAKYGRRGEELYVIQDTAAAAENIFLAATDLGLSACWVGAFDEKEVQRILNLESDIRPLVLMPVGHGK